MQGSTVELQYAGNGVWQPLTAFVGDGSSLTGLNAANPSSGTLADARLSANVALCAGGNAFTGNHQTNATDISITVPAPTGNRFYRLRKP